MNIQLQQRIKAMLSSDSLLYRILSNLYHLREKLWVPGQRSVTEILDSYSHFKKDVFFIQIGANDGVSQDIIHNYVIQNTWQGILVEPVSHLFEKLKQNYSLLQQRLFFENAAVSNNDGEAIFYRLKSEDPNSPNWLNQLGTFKKEIILKQRNEISGFDELLIEEKVKTISFDTLLQKYNVENVNLIQIDTEGYDFEIIKLINFNRLKLDLIIFEHLHLKKSDYKQALNLLKSNGFKLFTDEGNTIGLAKSLFGQLSL